MLQGDNGYSQDFFYGNVWCTYPWFGTNFYSSGQQGFMTQDSSAPNSQGSTPSTPQWYGDWGIGVEWGVYGSPN
jgi:hypothetical protein